MKKLIVAGCAIAVATFANAAVVDWEATGLAGYDGSTSSIDGTQIYGFDTSFISQQALLTAFATGGDDWSTALAKGYAAGDEGYDSGDAAGQIKGYANSQAVDAYLAIVDGKNIFISAVDGNGAKIGAEGQGPTIGFDLSDDIATKTTFKPGEASFTGASWYTATAVPEPTSGLLLLLGVAGLALRRRRA